MIGYTTARLTCVTLAVCVAGALSALSQTRQIVLLYDERTDLPGLAMLDAGFVRALTSGSSDQIEIYREAMDLSRFDSDAYRKLLRDHLRSKYAAKKIEVAVAVMEPALDFLLSHRDEVFPRAPIVFCGIDKGRLGGRPLPSDVTGVLLKREFSPTLELALGLHPGTERIVVVAGTSQFDARLLAQAREEFRPFGDRLAFTYLTAPPMPELLSQLSRLPPKTIVLYSTVFRDGGGNPFIPHEVAERVSAAANAPVYGFVDQYLGRGIVGGRLYGLGPHGEAAAGLVLQILKGTKPSELSFIEPASSVTAFDWQQLERWGIDEGRLPSGAIIRFRPVSFWSEYKYYVIGGLAILVAQTATIAALLLHRARRRRAERSLDETEARFRTAADAAPVMIWMSGLDKLCTFFNKGWLDFTGRPLEAELGNGWTEGVHPDDLAKCLKIYSESFDARHPFTMEYRLRCHDRQYRWVLHHGVPRYAPAQVFLGYIGSCVDMTDHKRAEESRRQLAHAARMSTMGALAGSLAHELNQPLTAILSNAQAGSRFLADRTPNISEVREALRDIAQDTKRAGDVIRQLRKLIKRDDLQFEMVDLNQLIHDVVRLLHGDAVNRNVQVVLDFQSDVPPVCGDMVQVQQVLLNLLLNAFDAMKDVPVSERKVCVRTQQPRAGMVQIEVRDHGTGIHPEKLARIFEPFETTKPDGLGLGLSISRSIVDAHGGRLWATNNVDQGATVCFTLPTRSVPPNSA